jgi:hypothetical protein
MFGIVVAAGKRFAPSRADRCTAHPEGNPWRIRSSARLRSRDKPPTRFGPVGTPRWVTPMAVVATFALLAAGLATSGLCGGGYSLILFGAAIVPLGYLFFRSGAWATVLPFAFAVVFLVAGGLYGASAAGCHL